jgi:alkanesulfonate monooxygenase SsuD/methylene tetrahydromethanopterin reductase-like flavin-dependent oxidoreductase (luciferase family)
MGTEVRTGVVATPGSPAGRPWADQVRALESAGWGALLVPDTLRTPSPFPTLAAAAAVTTTLRLRTWVVAAPFRTAGALAREASALQVLSGGRFELGIGPGRPDAEAETIRLEAHWGSAGERIEHVVQATQAVREHVRPVPAVAVAAAGDRMLAAATRLLAGADDRIALAVGPLVTVDEVARAADRVHTAAGRRVRLSHQVSGIGDAVPEWLSRGGLTAEVLRDGASAGWFPAGDPELVAVELRRRADELGIDEVVVPAELADAFAPVLERLAATAS